MAYATARGDVEIVAIDAMQIYRRMDIGTAKPSASDRRAVVHHGLDLVEPSQPYTVANFAATVGPIVADIASRGLQPLLVAGTGLYLRSLTDPMTIPGQWPDVRAALESRAQVDGSSALHAQLAELDPVAATRMEPSNIRRIVRALEVTLASGRPFSSFGSGLGDYQPTNFVQVGLRWSRATLSQRIDQRAQRMMASGLLAEVAGLSQETEPLSRTARQALGYKELIEHLEGKVGLDEATSMIVLRTRQFAVRQERWFRRDPRIRWVTIEHDPVAEALPVLLST